MNEEWWERPVCFVCDYGWALLLIALLGATAVFTRDYWWPGGSEPEIVLGTGDVQVTLRWSNLNDLDLHVIDPAGEEIFFQHRTSASGGQLDVDSNAGCTSNLTEEPLENIFWATGQAPHGTYYVHVRYFQQCIEQARTPFEVRFLVDGQTQTFTGEANSAGETFPVATFER
jgi:hypothetical protein